MIRSPRTALALCLAISAPATLVAGCGSSNSSSSDIGVGSILFVSRANTTVDPSTGAVSIDVSGGNSQVIDYERYVPGGSLNMLAPARPDGTLTNLTQSFPTADFNGVDVSFDATQAVFSMKKDGNDHYHIYTVQLTGDHAIHQKTAGDQDDINPIFIAGGRIVFATNEMYTEMGTRADEYEHGRVVSQLATISVDGGDADRRLFAQNLSHTVAPFIRSDGKLGYSRWEHLGPVNDVKIMAASPDGTNMLAVAGQHDKPVNSLVNVRETSPNMMIAIGTTRNRTIHAGTLVQVDARNHADPVCLDPNADYTGHNCLDEEHATYTILSKNVPTGSDPSPVGRYREPSVLPDGRLLVSWADGPVNDLNEQSLTPPDFGIYVFDPTTQTNQLVYNNRQMWDLGAIAVVPRKEPPVIGDLQHIQDATQPVRLGSFDVTQTSLQESVNGAEFTNTPLGQALHGAVAVRVVEGFSSEAAKGVTMFGLTMHEGAAVLGEAPVYADGSWLANVPPYIPMHMQPIDKFGLAIRSQGLWVQGEPGENRRCVGCHESRTTAALPTLGANPTAAEQAGAQTFTEQIADRLEIPWDKNDLGKPFIQQILDAKCTKCHDGGANDPDAGKTYQLTRTDPVTGEVTTYTIPYLKLTSDPVTVYYDRAVHTWPVSYVSLFYPSAMMMDMGTEKITGTVPPMWMVPANARGSAMIQKINVRAADGTTAWASTLHDEDQSSALTSDERKALILAADLGGQFYARQNTEFQANTSDPVAATK